MNRLKGNSAVTSCDECPTSNKSIFCELNKIELAAISERKSHDFYKKGQLIFSEGNIPQGLYCIFAGQIKIHKIGIDGHERILRFAKKGNIIGYRALLSTDNYHASATALEDSYICYFPKSVYQSKIANDPRLALQLFKVLSSDLKSAENKAMNLLQKRAHERMAETLLFLQDFFGVENDNATIKTTFTRESIGNISGTTPETASRILSELNKSKIIELVGKRIKILNHKALVSIANLTE